MSSENYPSNENYAKELISRSTDMLPPVLRSRANIHADTDITLRSIEGFTIKVHQLLLFCISPYFEKCFTISSNHGPTLNLAIEFETMRAIADYAYTGHVALTQDNVQHIREAADYYSIEGMVRICDKFIGNTHSSEQSIEEAEE